MALTSPSDPAGSFFVVVIVFCLFVFLCLCFSVKQLAATRPRPPRRPAARPGPTGPRGAPRRRFSGQEKAAGRLHLLHRHRSRASGLA